MQLKYGERCARLVRAVAFLVLALGVLSQIDRSVAHATFFSYGSPKVHIKVVDKAGPIRGRSSFTRYGEGGLPTLNIFEKAYSDGDRSFWADVEVEVKVRLKQNHWDHFKGGLSPDFYKWWCADHYDDPFFDPDPYDPTPPQPEGMVIGIDKFVKNKTDSVWPNFRIELGTGLGDEFVPSTDQDGLYFVTDPMAKEVTDNFLNPPFQTDDKLQWNAPSMPPLPPTTGPPSGGNPPGQQPGETSIYWFGVHVPAEFFEKPSQPHKKSFWHYNRKDGYWRARFTLRQHADVPIDPDIIVPEPSSVILAMFGIVGVYSSRSAQRQVVS